MVTNCAEDCRWAGEKNLYAPSLAQVSRIRLRVFG
jgi:hypothetical protein